MAKKNTQVITPSQMGFGFEVQDAAGNEPPFLYETSAVHDALDVISKAYWASVDTETTGLTDASIPVDLHPREFKQGASNLVRMRTIQVRVPTIRGRSGPRANFAFDVDKLSPKLLADVTSAVLSRKLFIAHNAGFDLYWLRLANKRLVMPELVLDSMLLTRLLKPQLVLRRAELIQQEGVMSLHDLAGAGAVAQAAWKSIVSGASGGSLADVVLAMFETVVDKTYQKPNNWTGLLGFEHYDYAIDDVVWADKIMCNLLNTADDGDLYLAYMGARARNPKIRLVEPQVSELVELREHGMPISQDVGVNYVKQQRVVLAKKVNELIELEPALAEHREALSNPDAGLDDALKKTLAWSFEHRGVVLRRTEATGSAQVGEKDLRACRAAQMETSRPLFNAWVAVCRAKKSANMAHDIVGFSKRGPDTRVRSLLSHGPVTGRLSASEPNCFTGDTEILTGAGWVRFDKLAKGALVAQYANGTIEFVAPTAYVTHAFNGNLTYNKSTAISLLTTPDHRCLVINPATGKQEVYSAQTYPIDRNQLHAATYVGGAGLPISEQELRFIVVAHVYGHWREGSVGFNFNYESKIKRFEQLFGVELPPRSHDKAGNHQATVPAVQMDKNHRLTAAAYKYLGAENEFSSWVLQLSRAQLDILVNELDACCASGGNFTNVVTNSKRSADWLQAIYALSSRNASLFSVKNPGERSPSSWRIKCSTRKAQSKTSESTRSEVPYSGRVYCVTVPSGFILVRHAGVTMITGNCQQFPRDQVFRAMCVSDTKPGCELVTVQATATTKDFLSKVAAQPLLEGESATVNSKWLAALYWADKNVPDWPPEERKALLATIDAQFTHYIVASDFGALDVRVGAALCVRSQREMLAAAKGIPVPGPVQPMDSVLTVIRRVARCLGQAEPIDNLKKHFEEYGARIAVLEAEIETLKRKLDANDIERKVFFRQRSDLKAKLLPVKIGWRLSQCLMLGMARGEPEYSALRDAFVADIDIHTFTGMKLTGRDPMKEFEGLSPSDRKALEKKLKKELGPRRQQGKIANLSLLYGMADAGFQEAAARGYDEHWTMKEAHDIRALWMNAYPEVELWHLWTECLQAGVVYIPEMGKERLVRTAWWQATTLAGRDIVAYGLNAALSYQDQSTGADILGMIMHRLKKDYSHIFDLTINQVHDELVLALPIEKHDEYLEIVEQVMVECSNSLTMPYGVPCAVSPASGVIWIKD